MTFATFDSIQDGVGRSQVLSVVEGLSQLGWRMRLVSFEGRPLSANLSKRLLERDIDAQWMPFGAKGSIGAARRILELSRSLGSSQILHSRSDLPVLSAQMSGSTASLLWDVRSLWAQQRLAAGSLRRATLAYLAASGAERLAAKRADAMLTLSSSVIPYLDEQFRRLPSIREVVPTLVDTEHFRFVEMPELNRVSVLFSGTYNGFYDLGLSARFVDALRRHASVDTMWCRAPASESALLDAVSPDTVMDMTYDALPAVLAESHVGMAICRMDAPASLSAAVPTKIGEFLSVGRPIVVAQGTGDLDELIAQSRVGVTVTGVSHDEISRAAQQTMDLLQDPDTPDRCRAAAETFFDLRVGIRRISETYRRLGAVPTGVLG